MHPNQEQFFNFMLETAQNGKQDEMKTLLLQCFETEKAVPLTLEAFENLCTQLIAISKPQEQNRIQEAIKHFRSTIR